jgi:hypothetical protein
VLIVSAARNMAIGDPALAVKRIHVIEMMLSIFLRRSTSAATTQRPAKTRWRISKRAG